MNTATLTVPGRLHGNVSRTRQERRPSATSHPTVSAQPAARSAGPWLAVSHWLGNAFATWASGGRAL